MSSQEDIELLIDQYVSGELIGNELDEFEAKLSGDEDLQREVKLHRDIQNAVSDDEVADFRSIINEVIEDKKSAEGFSFYKIAAGLVPLIIGGVFIYFYWFNVVPSHEIADKYLYPYENLLTVRSDQGSDSESPALQADLNAAMAYYDNENYVEAVKYFNKLGQTDQDLVSLYLGISYIYLNEIDAAVEALSVPRDNNEGLYRFPAMYYVAIARLKNGDLDESKKILVELKDNSSQPYRKYAAEILEEL